VQHADLLSDEEIAPMRCQCLRLQFGSVRIGAAVSVSLWLGCQIIGIGCILSLVSSGRQHVL
jgi:hypothetical protein